LLSILVISRTKANVTRLLEAIAHNGIGMPYEVLCSWNGEANEVDDIQAPHGLVFRLFEQRPYNFARNNNGLARQARGELVLFLNDDVIPDRGAIGRALDAIRDPAVGIVGINLRYTDGRLQHAGIFFRADGTPYHRLKQQVRWDDPQVATDMFIPCVTGAFILMRRTEFDALRFDENFSICGEDIALNLSYREKFEREILYVAGATAIHIENATRKKAGETKTPPEDMARILTYSRRTRNGRPLTEVRRPRIRIMTEKPGWIMYRKAEEILKHMGAENVRINEEWPEADIHYYINYGYFRAKSNSGLTLANFTHYDPDHLADKFVHSAREVDHCVAVSEATADTLRGLGIPNDKITVILVGADRQFQPKLTVGLVGRVYPGGRKGEDIVRALLDDGEISAKVRIVAMAEGWGVPVWGFDEPADFYRAIDYLLVPSRIEGGPVPFMEALACGTMSIAPQIGVVPQFPHVSYPVGDVPALKKALLELADQHLMQRHFLTSRMRGVDWSGWAVEHEKLFRRLLWNEKMKGSASDWGVKNNREINDGCSLEKHKQKWELLAQENDRYYVRSVEHHQSDEEYEGSGRQSVREFIENDMALMSRLGTMADKVTLEIGCGSGRITKSLASLFGRVVAVDISPTMLEKARQFVCARNVEYVESDGVSISVPAGSIDVAFSYIVYQHFPSKDAVSASFQNVSRALRAGGLFKVQVRGQRHPDPNHWSWGPEFDEGEAAALARSSGFRILNSSGVGTRSYWLLLEKLAAK
jgi:SAM-dependent methyltransferase/glycosyltransferase involved in cell wall biosynthesis